MYLFTIKEVKVPHNYIFFYIKRNLMTQMKMHFQVFALIACNMREVFCVTVDLKYFMQINIDVDIQFSLVNMCLYIR